MDTADADVVFVIGPEFVPAEEAAAEYTCVEPRYNEGAEVFSIPTGDEDFAATGMRSRTSSRVRTLRAWR